MRKVYTISMESDEDMLLIVEYNDEDTIKFLANEIIGESIGGACTISEEESEEKARESLLIKKMIMKENNKIVPDEDFIKKLESYQ